MNKQIMLFHTIICNKNNKLLIERHWKILRWTKKARCKVSIFMKIDQEKANSVYLDINQNSGGYK